MEKYPEVQHIALRALRRNSKNPILDLALIEEFRRKFKRLKPDLIINYTHKPNIYGGLAAKILGIPSIAMVTGLGYAFINKGLINKVTRFLYRLSSRYHKKFIFENIDDRKLFENSGLIRKGQGVSVKGCGVNIDYFQPCENGISSEKTIFAFIGRLLYDKGIVEYVKAAESIKKIFPDTEFWVVGELDISNPSTVKEEDLLSWIENKIIIYHGFVRDVRPFIRKSHCVVLPSYREAIPRTITEAMAMAKPVITSQTAGCWESVDEGVNGYLAEIKSADALVSSLKTFMSLSPEQKKEMGQAGRRKAEREFDDRKIASDIYDIIYPILQVE